MVIPEHGQPGYLVHNFTVPGQKVIPVSKYYAQCIFPNQLSKDKIRV